MPANLLIVEDEAMLRGSLARGLSKMADVVVADAGSVDDALGCIDEVLPDVIISDIDMPERSGVELFEELGRRGLSVPIIFVSAYLKAYRSQIPQSDHIDLVEKPVALAALRELVQQKLARAADRELGPFTVPDYLQLAGMGRRSVVVDATLPGGFEGRIVVRDGQAWSAECGPLDPLEAFALLAWTEGASVRVQALGGDPGERTLEGSVEGVLMESARIFDESRRDGEDLRERMAAALGASEANVDESPTPVTRPTMESIEADWLDVVPDEPPQASEAAASEAESRRLREEGLEHTLGRDFAAAFAAFAQAERLCPGDPVVAANLSRLREMGFGEADEEER